MPISGEEKPLLEDGHLRRQSQCSEAVSNEAVKAEPLEVEVEEGLIGWLVVLASFLCIALLDGVGYTTGILQNSMMTDLASNKAELAFSGSLQVCVYCVTGPVVSRLINNWGNRPVCIIGCVVAGIGMFAASFGTSLGSVLVGYSVVTGAGFGMMYLPSVTGSAPFFNKRRSLALAICLCGSGVGTFLMAPVTEEILDRFGWRWVLRFLGSLCFMCIFCGLCMFPSPIPPEDPVVPSPAEEAKLSTGEKLRARYRFVNPVLLSHPNFPTFLLVILADFSAFLGIYIPFSHLPTIAMVNNISSTDAAFLISSGGISNMLGRILGGWLSDFNCFHPLGIAIISISLSSAPAFLLSRVTTYSLMLSSFFFYGVCTGCLVGATGPLLVKLLGVKVLNQTFGLLSAARGIAVLLGAPAAGMVVEMYGEPGLAMFVCGIFSAISALSYCAAAARHWKLFSRRRRRGYVEL